MSKSGSTKNFESALAELETIVTQMENGQLPLEHSLAAYKQGIELLRYCQQTLQATEQQIQILNEKNILEPYAND